MARRLWLLGAAVVAIALLASAPGASKQSAANAGTAVATTAQPTSTTRGTTTTTVAPATTTSSTTTSTSTTSTSTTTSSTTSTSATVGAAPRPFDAAAFDAVIAAGTVGIGDISAGVAVVRDGTVIHASAFGMENPLAAVAASDHTRWRLASISKLFTTVTVMQLVEEGRVDLDRSFAGQIGETGPFADPRFATITVRQLLSHMSGLPVARGVFFGRGAEDWHQAARLAFTQTLDADPGTAFRYSNTNFCMLGLLIEHITGQSFESAVEERVLEPLDIHAHVAPTLDTRPGDAFHPTGAGRNYMEVLGPAGAWVARPSDIALLLASLRPENTGTRLLSTESVAEMRVRVPVPVETPPPANGWSYGLGTMIFADGSWGHTGTIESTHAMVVNRNDALTVALLISGKYPSNSDDLWPLIDQAVAAASIG